MYLWGRSRQVRQQAARASLRTPTHRIFGHLGVARMDLAWSNHPMGKDLHPNVPVLSLTAAQMKTLLSLFGSPLHSLRHPSADREWKEGGSCPQTPFGWFLFLWRGWFLIDHLKTPGVMRVFQLSLSTWRGGLFLLARNTQNDLPCVSQNAILILILHHLSWYCLFYPSLSLQMYCSSCSWLG